jgi:hypothetical protein
VGMAYRVFQRDASRENAVGVLREALKSCPPAAQSAAAFQAIRDRPKRDADAAALREQKVVEWFDRKGWPRPDPRNTIRQGDCSYRWVVYRGPHSRSGLDIACLAGSLPAEQSARPPWLNDLNNDSQLHLAQYRWARGEWQFTRPGQTLYKTHEPWSAFQQDSFQKDRVY